VIYWSWHSFTAILVCIIFKVPFKVISAFLVVLCLIPTGHHLLDIITHAL
jgi:hypothetical protein